MLKLLKSQNQIVQEIHNEFDSSEEKLLMEARRIINENSDVDVKAERLISVGFVNTELAVKHLAKSKKLVTGTEQAKLIEYYRQKYPFNKFITEQELDRICKKYNLIYAPVANYKKDVPDKNLKEIEVCSKLANEDYPKNILKCKVVFSNFIISFGRDFLSMWNKSWWIMPRTIDGNFRSTSAADEYYKNKYGIAGVDYVTSVVRNIEINKQGLFIAAPNSHFDLTGLQKEGLLNSTFTIVETKDPIVFRFVKGGVQIISKWGLEAEDADLINEKMN